MHTGETSPVAFAAPIPVLRMFDVARAKAFYLDFLGFTLDWEHVFEPGMPLYCQVSRSGLTLHLSEHHGDGSPGVVVFAPMEGIEAYQRELLTKDYASMRPGLHAQPWGVEMQVWDPSGNRIRFCERGGAG
jgi:predicted enzyme related to lactoylglutathione lyase